MRDKRTCRARVRMPINIFLCTVLVTLQRLGQISYHFDDSRPCSTHQYLYVRWSTFSDRFHNVSFTMQSDDHNWSISLLDLRVYSEIWSLKRVHFVRNYISFSMSVLQMGHILYISYIFYVPNLPKSWSYYCLLFRRVFSFMWFINID